MRLGAVFQYELRLQVRRPTLWIYAATLLWLAAIVAQGGIESARNGEALFDAPVEVASVLLIATLAGLLTAAALAADSATRDASTRMAPLFAATPLRRHEYLGGRFLAAFALYALALLLVPLAHLIARFVLPAELVLPLRPMTYVEGYLFVALPNAFISTAILFAVAALTRRAVASYVAGALLLVATMLSFQLSVTLFAASEHAGLLDPFAFAALRRTVAGWTATQQNTRALGLEGELLWNRVTWVAVACVVLAGMWWRSAASGSSIERAGRAPSPAPTSSPALTSSRSGEAAVANDSPIAIPATTRRFGLRTALHQTAAIGRRAFLDVATSWGALVIVGIAVFHVVIGPELMEHLGVPLHPTTAAVVRILTGMSTAIPMLSAMLAIFYAGELIWNERDLRLAPLTGSAPVSGWALLLGKFLGLGLALAALQVLLIAAGVITQAMLGYYDFEPRVYAGTLLGLQLADGLIFAALAMAIQVVAGGKYVGWLAAAVAWVWTVWPDMQPEHRMLLYGADPGWTYSAMSGFGASLGPVLWFSAWWAAWALLFAVLARLFVVRGIDLPFRERLTLAPQRLTRPTMLAAVTATGAVCGLGGFIFWNTNVVNEFVTADELSARRVEYERRYGTYENAPQPVRTATSLEVELYPSRRTATIRGSYVLRNDTGAPIDTLHLSVASEVETGPFELGRRARAAVVDDELGHRIYVLDSPLAPGDSLSLGFDLTYAPRGFSNDGAAGDVIANGTYFELPQWLPGIGYQPSQELMDARARRDHGLPPRGEYMPEDRAAVTRQAGDEHGRFRAVIGTDSGQTAISSGVLRGSWTDGGRAYFEYEAAAPIRRRVAILSARYDVHRDEWRGIPIEVFYHPGHPWNADRTVRSVKASLEHFTRTIGPYPYGVVRVVERPDTEGGATAFPGLVAYSEPLALMRPEADARGLDFQFAVMAHEMAHQWWGNQLGPAQVDGAWLLTESLAWYGALGVVEETYGRRHFDALLELMHEAFLAPMTRANPPLIHANDGFLGYRKGAFAMYSAREHLGEERVTAALRSMFEAHTGGRLPDPTSLDLVAALRAVAPDSLQPLLHDLFEQNVWWELGVRQARGRQLASGEWEVSVQLRALKVAIDTAGNETVLPLDELVEIGLFVDDPGAQPVYLRMHRLRNREQTIVVTVPEQPAHAMVDPRHLLVDRIAEDDSRPVVVAR